MRLVRGLRLATAVLDATPVADADNRVVFHLLAEPVAQPVDRLHVPRLPEQWRKQRTGFADP